MKLQLQGQHLRVRITEAELAELRAGVTLENITRLGPDAAWRQSLRQTDADAPELRSAGGHCVIGIPANMIEAYAQRLPCRDGLALHLQTGTEAVELVFEVDVRDSVRTRGGVRRQH